MKITTLKNPSRKPYIYKVTSFETGQYYIGSQCRGLTIGVNYFTSSHNKEFKEGFKTYGEEKYKIEIIKEFDDPKECVDAENYMIRDHMQLKDGLCLNRAYHCNGEKIFSTVGSHHSEEARKKISITRKGRPHPHKGMHPSEETRKKLSESHKGQSAWNKGTHPSEETRKKLSETHKGQSAWNKGMHPSEETRKKLSESHKGLPATNRIKISIEGIVFNSLAEASKYYNVDISTIRCWAKNNKHNAKKI